MAPDEMAAKTEPVVDNLLEEQLRATLKDLQRAGLQPKPVEDLHGSEDVQSLLSRHLDQDSSERRAIYSRLQTIEGAIKRRRSRGIVRFLIAFGIGVAATLGWQSYGETSKQIIATKAPELGWTKQSASPQITVVSSAPETAQPNPEPSVTHSFEGNYVPAPARKPTPTAPTSSRTPIP